MKSLLRYRLFLFFLFIIMTACAVTSKKVYEENGLVTGKPGMNSYPADAPGETTPLERYYTIAPPGIPHSIDEFSINRSSNDCLDCHQEGVEVEEGHIATKVPSSHYLNKYTGEKKDQIIGIRYNCLQCHVPQSNEEPPYAEKKR